MVSAAGDPFAQHDTRELTGHKHKVLTLGWNCNGKRLATGANDGTIKIWRIDPKHSRPERPEGELLGHTAELAYIRWDPANIERLASIAQDKTVRLWDARSSKCLGTIKSQVQLLFVTWKPDGSELMFLDKQDTLSVVDTRTMKVVRTHRYAYVVNEMLWTRDGKHCFVALDDGTVEIVEYPSFEKLRSFAGHSTAVFHMCLDRTGRYLATGSTDACIALWDVEDMVCVRTFASMDNEVNNLSFTPDGRHISYFDKLAGLSILDVETGEVVHRVQLAAGFVPDALDWNPRHQVLAWPGPFQSDPRDPSRDCGPVIILAPR